METQALLRVYQRLDQFKKALSFPGMSKCIPEKDPFFQQNLHKRLSSRVQQNKYDVIPEQSGMGSAGQSQNSHMSAAENGVARDGQPNQGAGTNPVAVRRDLGNNQKRGRSQHARSREQLPSNEEVSEVYRKDTRCDPSVSAQHMQHADAMADADFTGFTYVAPVTESQPARQQQLQQEKAEREGQEEQQQKQNLSPPQRFQSGKRASEVQSGKWADGVQIPVRAKKNKGGEKRREEQKLRADGCFKVWSGGQGGEDRNVGCWGDTADNVHSLALLCF